MRTPDLSLFERWEALPVRDGESRADAAARVRQALMEKAREAALIYVDRGAALVRREPWDCDRLRLEAGKLEYLIGESEEAVRRAVDAALVEAKRAGFQHLCARVATTDRTATSVLSSCGRFELVDTVVTLSLERPAIVEPAPSGVRRATAEDSDALAALAGDAFTDRASTFNRYLNDRRLPLERVRDVYEHWARTSISGPAADATFVLEREGRLAGFLTLVRARDGVAKVALNAVSRSERGHGVYRALVLAALAECWTDGAKRVEIVTQLQQLAVQRTWWRLGATQVSSAHSFHVWLD